MRREPLETVLRLRRHAVDEARRALTDSLVAVTEAEMAAHQLQRDIQAETERAADLAGGDAMVEAFAAWLPAARRRLSEARTVQDRHEAEVARCRAELTASRAAMQAVEALLSERRAKQADALGKQVQRGLDEAASRTTAEP